MSDKGIRLELRVWYDPGSRHIKLAGEGLTASTVSNDPGSKRYHPNLYRKLANALREAGAPAPEQDGPAKRGGGSLFEAIADTDGGDFEFEPPQFGGEQGRVIAPADAGSIGFFDAPTGELSERR